MSDKFPSGHLDELPMLVAYLDMYRDAIVRKIEGLDEEQARWRPTEQASSLLNLVVHLTGVERRWFQRTILGGNPEVNRDAEFGEIIGAVAEAVAAYRAEWERNNAIANGLSPDDPCKGEPGYSVRWVLLHLLEETARHAGHADITRELIDGAVGF